MHPSVRRFVDSFMLAFVDAYACASVCAYVRTSVDPVITVLQFGVPVLLFGVLVLFETQNICLGIAQTTIWKSKCSPKTGSAK